MGSTPSSQKKAKAGTREHDRDMSWSTVEILLFGGEESSRSALLERIELLYPKAEVSAEQPSASIAEGQGVLYAKEQTTGVTETTFKVRELTYKLVDVGLQRSDPFKWMPCFADVEAILFFVNWSEYDQMIDDEEGGRVNALKESLASFETICNSQWFQNTNIIFVPTDIDAFARKLRLVPLSDYFPDYTAGEDYHAAHQYLLKRFMWRGKFYVGASPGTSAVDVAQDLQMIRSITVAIDEIRTLSALEKP
ncbi:guanine nucleotide-binding protein alpha subunit [Mycena olivaceomarginata]|nr:guanine nucleotide-binding protein alpha subunit [Mycena olivaceomarginata]